MSLKPKKIIRGNAPVVISVPHAGTYIPAGLKPRFTQNARLLHDTDWHVDRLYDFALSMDVTFVMATHSRYVVDLNRSPDDESLYPGQVKTGLCPKETFDGKAIYKKNEEPDAVECLNRVAAYWLPYHEALEEELARVKKKHGYAILYDAHSIKSKVPRLFDGQLPDLCLGTAKGVSCADSLVQSVLKALENEDYKTVLNDRFVGGYITRNYGDPANNIHAIQMELSQVNYMDEIYPYAYEEEKADVLRQVLKKVIQALLDWDYSKAT